MTIGDLPGGGHPHMRLVRCEQGARSMLAELVPVTAPPILARRPAFGG